MAKKIEPNNYMVIQGWMITELGLKGNELIVYAVIFSFSQTNNTKFSGSLQYLADWCNSTTRTVQTALKNLLDKDLIEKEETFINGVKFCSYLWKKIPMGMENFSRGYGKNFVGGMENFSTNNNIIINKDNIDINIYINILSFLNEKTGKNFKHTSQKTRKLINARLKEGYNENDFYRVIEIKCNEWLKDEKMNKYLCPDTLFGTKFEKYLNQGVGVNEKYTRDGKDQFGNTVL